MQPHRTSRRRSAFTLTEILVVVAVIGVLVSLLLTALGGVWSSGEMTKSMNNLRQIAGWMSQYSVDNNDTVLPSRFNYRDDPYPGKARSSPSQAEGQQHSGTWSDILHTVFEVAAFPEAGVALGNDYRFDSPDKALYDLFNGSLDNPLRAAVPNSRNWMDRAGIEPPKPFGKGAQERGYPGFFAANDFFNAGWVKGPDGRFLSNGQIRFPDQSMYLVDSYIGETIEAGPRPFDSVDANPANGKPDWEVDLRYAGGTAALMLFLDGHVDTALQWENLADLESRRVRVCRLDERDATCPDGEE